MRRVHLARLHLEEVQPGRHFLPAGFANVDGTAGSAIRDAKVSLATSNPFSRRAGLFPL